MITAVRPRRQKKRPPPDNPLEHQEQVAFFQWIEKQPLLRNLTFAIPNGGTRDPIEAKHLKEEGVRRGVPDIFVALPLGGYHGLFIEMKRRKGSTISKDQREWIEKLQEQGYVANICMGFDEARAAVERYLLSNGYTISGKGRGFGESGYQTNV